MSGIVCAVRGGPDSRQAIEKSIALAKESGLPLIFLYIVNIDFLDHTMVGQVQIITQEIRQMGEFILLTAQMAASKEGIEAQRIIREGKVTEQISEYCHEISADYLVLGRPRFQLENSLFTKDLLTEFIERIQEQTGARVVLPEEDES